MVWFDLLGSSRDSQESSPTPQFKTIDSSLLSFFTAQLSHPYMTTGKTIALTRQTFLGKVMSLPSLKKMASKLCSAVRIIKVFSSVQSLSRVQLFATPWTAAHQASLSITNSQSLLKFMSIQSVMPSNHLILCHPTSPPAFNLFQHLSLFQCVSSLHQVAKVLELQLQHQSFQ